MFPQYHSQPSILVSSNLMILYIFENFIHKSWIYITHAPPLLHLSPSHIPSQPMISLLLHTCVSLSTGLTLRGDSNSPSCLGVSWTPPTNTTKGDVPGTRTFLIYGSWEDHYHAKWDNFKLVYTYTCKHVCVYILSIISFCLMAPISLKGEYRQPCTCQRRSLEDLALIESFAHILGSPIPGKGLSHKSWGSSKPGSTLCHSP